MILISLPLSLVKIPINIPLNTTALLPIPDPPPLINNPIPIAHPSEPVPQPLLQLPLIPLPIRIHIRALAIVKVILPLSEVQGCAIGLVVDAEALLEVGGWVELAGVFAAVLVGFGVEGLLGELVVVEEGLLELEGEEVVLLF